LARHYLDDSRNRERLIEVQHVKLIHPRLLQLPLCGCLALASVALVSQAQAQDQSTPAATQPDNSAKNKAHAKTAEQQSEGTSDRMLTKKIRQSIVADKSISTYGHNVKIITQNGMVTLKGPVKSDEEKTAIASKAAEVAGGQDKVTNQLTVKQ
jgi:osmotically-inducible protein OsmY